jgi:uncharacterized protein with HEPN domain
MQRDLLLLGEMIDAAERARQLANGVTIEELQADRLRGESLLWNFTVLGEAASQLSDAVKERFPHIPWQQPARLRNRIVHGYWSIDMEILHTTANDQLPSFAGELRKVLDALTAEAEDAPAAEAEDATSGPAAGEQATASGGPAAGAARTED